MNTVATWIGWATLSVFTLFGGLMWGAWVLEQLWQRACRLLQSQTVLRYIEEGKRRDKEKSNDRS